MRSVLSILILALCFSSQVDAFSSSSRSFHRARASPTRTPPSPLGRLTDILNSRRTYTDLQLSLLPESNQIISSLLSYNGNVPVVLSVGINFILFAALRSKLNTMLTPAGFLHSFALGCGLWTTLGWRGWTICVMYLLLGQAVTKLKFKEKNEAGIAESRGGRRGPENVWGSAATGLICAFAAAQGGSLLGLSEDIYVLAFVASLSTKLSDTFASEIGKAYGKTTFLITSLERVPPGTEGAISAEGTGAALVGGALLSLYALSIGMITLPQLFVASVSAFLATNAESWIGATLQEKEGFEWMTNEVVNFINTLIGASLAVIGGKVILGM